MSNPDPLQPPPQLLIKLGSAIVHFDEMRSYNFDQGRHEYSFDLAAIDTLLNDKDVQAWLKQMTDLAFLPVKRG